MKSGVVEDDNIDMMVIKEGGNNRTSGDQQVSSIKREQVLIKIVVIQINTDGHR